MIIDAKKLQLMLARRQMSIRDLLRETGIAARVIGHIKSEHALTTKCVGRICAALNCDPTELIKEDKA